MHALFRRDYPASFLCTSTMLHLPFPFLDLHNKITDVIFRNFLLVQVELAEIVAAAFQPSLDVSKRFGSQFTLVCQIV